ncbi:hypothetical protein D3Y59_04115 [Hymenobacter oligotrophus]|uniref:DUF1795 domain-containing protein n=1 Tax=Hymenobacter oligotrophus TaxID=2319843 RepID=A0A3B7QTI2_9BACT|nr:hypothetical protein [Hymenobacter oligotrophus]AYA36318.1 hypothetical protein D3Y59_04115 [Hymenobacter oligotrophus]
MPRFLPFTLLSGLLAVGVSAQAQDTLPTNFQVVLNGQVLDVEPGKTYSYTTPKGEVVQVQLRESSIRHFRDEWVSFQHPPKLSVAETQEEGIRQLILMNAAGAGVLVQEYTGLDPKDILEFMITQLTKDEVKAGYKRQDKAYEKKLADGKLLNGKTVYLSQKNARSVYQIGTWSGENEGIMVVTINREDGSSSDAANQKLISDVVGSMKILR